MRVFHFEKDDRLVYFVKNSDFNRLIVISSKVYYFTMEHVALKWISNLNNSYWYSSSYEFGLFL